jgi:hypothetical protein
MEVGRPVNNGWCLAAVMEITAGEQSRGTRTVQNKQMEAYISRALGLITIEGGSRRAGWEPGDPTCKIYSHSERVVTECEDY